MTSGISTSNLASYAYELATALLVFLTAATNTRVITADLKALYGLV